MENYLREELRAGKAVSVKIEVGYPSSGGARPEIFNVIAKINGITKEFPFRQ